MMTETAFDIGISGADAAEARSMQKCSAAPIAPINPAFTARRHDMIRRCKRREAIRLSAPSPPALYCRRFDARRSVPHPFVFRVIVASRCAVGRFIGRFPTPFRPRWCQHSLLLASVPALGDGVIAPCRMPRKRPA